MIAVLGLYQTGFSSGRYDVVVDFSEQTDLFRACKKIAYALGYAETADGRMSAAMLLDVIMVPNVGFKPRALALRNFDSIMSSDKLFCLELVSSLARLVLEYKIAGTRWIVDIYLND